MDYQRPFVPQVGTPKHCDGRQQISRASTMARPGVGTPMQGLQPKLTSSQASISQTLGPSAPLRFGCCTKNTATNKSPQQEKTQGKPALHRLRANSTPSPAFQMGNFRHQKRDFAATHSPGGAHDEAEERYWRRRGAIRSTPTGGSPLNSPIEKPRLNYDTWILPSRIAFLPRVRKWSLLAGQVREKFHAQVAGHPVIIMSAPNSRGVVAIALLTSLGGQTVQEKYSKVYAGNPDRAREFGGDFLLIKHGDTQPHDDTPLLRLKDGKEMGRRSYVNVAYGNFYVQVEDLALYRKNGSGKDSEVFLDEASFQELVRYRDGRLMNQAYIDQVKWPAGWRRPSESQLGTNAMARLPFAALA